MDKLNDIFASQEEKKKDIKIAKKERKKGSPSKAYVGAAWASLIAGVGAYGFGLYNATMMLNEKGYYGTVMLYGLFSAISLQKTVRDKEEGIPVTNIYYMICWFGILSAVGLLAIGLWNATLLKSEKGFYAMSFVLSLFASVTVQKNIRDLKD